MFYTFSPGSEKSPRISERWLLRKERWTYSGDFCFFSVSGDGHLYDNALVKVKQISGEFEGNKMKRTGCYVPPHDTPSNNYTMLCRSVCLGEVGNRQLEISLLNFDYIA